MAGRGTKATIRARAVRRKKHHNSRMSRRNLGTKRARLKRSRSHVQGRNRGPRISRTRLRGLRDDLDGMRNTVTDTFDKFWIIPEQDIRETLARTQRKIGRAVDMLKRAA